MINADNLLLTLAWLGEVDTVQLQRLYLPGYVAKRQYACLALLNELRHEGYVTRRRWGRIPTNRAPSPTSSSPLPMPVPQPMLWSLTKAGLALVKDEAQYPPVYLGPRSRRMVPHDLRTTEFIVRLVELQRVTRAGLSGLYVEREVQLNPPQRRPIMDALVMVTRGGDLSAEAFVPWTKDRVYGGETRTRYALENDRATEPLGVIAAKAEAYRMANTVQWQERNGDFPVVIWLAPSESRLAAINRAWAERWPGGKWLLTTDAWLCGDYFMEYDGGQHRTRGLFRTTPTLPKALPAEQ